MSPAPRGHGEVSQSHLIINCGDSFFIKRSQLKQQKKIKCYIQLFLREKKYKTTKISKDLFKNITGFLKRDYFEMITASKAVTWTNQKASSTDQRHTVVIHHFPKGKKDDKNAFRLETVKVYIIRFFTISISNFLPSLNGSVQVCTPHTCLPTSSLSDLPWISNRELQFASQALLNWRRDQQEHTRNSIRERAPQKPED